MHSVDLGENVSVDLDASVNANVESQDKNESLVESDAGEDSGVNVNVDAVVNANVRSQDKMDKATEYLDSLSDDMKKEFLSLRISDLWDFPDCRSVLLPFVKSYLQARSEGSAEKDAVPAEDEPDPSNSNDAGRDCSISSQEDMRGKNANQDSEAAGHIEQLDTATGIDSDHEDRESEPECTPEPQKGDGQADSDDAQSYASDGSWTVLL